MQTSFVSRCDYERYWIAGRPARVYSGVKEENLRDVSREVERVTEIFLQNFNEYDEDLFFVDEKFFRMDCVAVEINAAVLSNHLVKRFIRFLKDFAPEYAITGRVDFEADDSIGDGLFFINLKEIVVEDSIQTIWIGAVGDVD